MSENEVKELAFYFFETFKIDYTKPMIAKTMTQAKSLLKTYTLEEVKEVINIIRDTGKYPFSLGYISVVISDVIVKARKNIEMKNYKPERIEFISDNKKELSSYDLPNWIDNDLFKE